VAVDGFEFGGMENSNCTTLTRLVLHDKKNLMTIKMTYFWFAMRLHTSGLAIWLRAMIGPTFG
jgi:hypothetical protein